MISLNIRNNKDAFKALNNVAFLMLKELFSCKEINNTSLNKMKLLMGKVDDYLKNESKRYVKK